jgi:hypothetical protein
MAEQIHSRRRSRPRGRPSIYDWDRYSDGSEHICWPGQEFHCAPTSFRALVYRTADARGLKATVTLDKHTGSVRFRMTPQ